MEQNLVAKLQAEARERVAYWQGVERALAGGVVESPAPVAAPTAEIVLSKPADGRKRAPAGELKRAIRAVVGKTPIGNGEIRQAIAKAKYPYPLDNVAVSRALGEMVEAKELKRTGTLSAAKYVKA